MDYRAFCRKQNCISYSHLIEELADQDLVFIGEAHNNPTHFQNEAKLLTNLAILAGRLSIAVEDIHDKAVYQFKREFFRKLNRQELTYLHRDNQKMAQTLARLVQRDPFVTAVIGEDHLTGLSVDSLVNIALLDLRIATVIQPENIDSSEGIYHIGRKGYIILGSLN